MKSASREFICKIQMKKLQEYSAPGLKAVWTESITDRVDLEAEYRRTRAALLNAGVDMTDNMDALYRDWRRWRDMPKTVTQANRPGAVAVGSVVGSSPGAIQEPDRCAPRCGSGRTGTQRPGCTDRIASKQ